MRRAWVLFVFLAGCGEGKPPQPPEKQPEKPSASKLPDRVVYDQILVVFKGSYARTESERTPEQARALAYNLLDRVRAGVDFDALKREFSDDRNPETGTALGPYKSVKSNLRREGDEMPMGNLHKGLAEVVYGLEVGGVGIVDFDPARFPIGWMLVKRLK